MNLRKNEPSELWTFGKTNRRNYEPSEKWIVGIMNPSENEPTELWTFGKNEPGPGAMYNHQFINLCAI